MVNYKLTLWKYDFNALEIVNETITTQEEKITFSDIEMLSLNHLAKFYNGIAVYKVETDEDGSDDITELMNINIDYFNN